MAYQNAVTEILASAMTLIADKTRIAAVFQASGIAIDDTLTLVVFLGHPESCVNILMDKLLYIPPVRISAQRILREQGLTHHV